MTDEAEKKWGRARTPICLRMVSVESHGLPPGHFTLVGTLGTQPAFGTTNELKPPGAHGADRVEPAKPVGILTVHQLMPYTMHHGESIGPIGADLEHALGHGGR